MNTLKKLFSVSAIVALLGTLAPMYAFGATYTDEQVEAYEYAHSKGITTMETIEKANMEGNLTRIAMAKMIANYATAVLGLEPDTSAKCTFSDVTAALDAQYDNGVTNACQLGLMGQNITAFRPNDPVTRGEFGTTLSRALNANDPAKLAEMNKANPFYEAHLNFLKEEGIMNNISNPNMNERRGWVMIMMMRADEEYTEASEGCSMNELLACFGSDDVAACMAACNGEEEPAEEEQDPEEVKAGTLNVTMKSEEGGDVPYGVSALPVVTYTLKAADEDINISSLVLSQAGYGHADTVTGVALFINGQRVSKVKDLDLNKDLTLNLTNAYTVKAGKSVDIEVRATLGDTANAKGSQFAIKLEEVQSSAEKVKLPSNVTSNTFKLVTTSATTATIAARNPVDAPKAGTDNADIFEFSIEGNSTQDVTVKNITFVGVGGGSKNTNPKDYKDFIKNIKLLMDDEVVATAEMNGKYLTFNLSKEVVVEKGKTEIFTVRADVIGGAGETLDFAIEDAMDVVINGNTYNAPVTVAGANSNFAAVTVLAGKVVIERTNPTETTFVKNKKNVYLGSFTVNNNGDNELTLEKMGLKVTYVGSTDYIESLKVRYGSSNAGNTELTYNSASGTYVDDTELSIGKKVTVYIYADIKKDVTLNTTDTFTVSLDKGSFKIVEDENDNVVTEVSFPASFATMEASTSDLTVTQVTLGNKSFSKGTADIDAVSFKVKTSTTAGVKVKNLVFKAKNNMTDDPATDTAATCKLNGGSSVAAGEASEAACKALAVYTPATTDPVAPATCKLNGGSSVAAGEASEAACKALAVYTAAIPAGTQSTYNVDSNTIRSAKLVVNDKDEYDATIGTDTITVKSPITLDANTTTTFVLKVSLESEPKVTGFKYTFDGTNSANFVAEDTTSDRNPIERMGESAINGRNITVLSAGKVTLSYEANNTNNKNAKSILAGNGVVVAEYNLYATHEQAKAKNIVLTFNAPSIKDSVDDVEIYYGEELVASNPTWDTAGLIATFSNVNLTIIEEETPLTVRIVSSAINSDGGAAVQGASITKIEFTNVSGKTSGIAINGVVENTDSSLFDIAPVTLATSVANVSTSNTNTFNVLATKGNNTNSEGDVAKATLKYVYLNVTSNNALTALTIKDTDGNTVASACDAYSKADYSTAATLSKDLATAYVKCTMNDNYLIGNGGEGTDLVVEATVDGSVNTPSYTLSLKGVDYTTNASSTTEFSDRATSVKNLISK